MDFTKIGDGNGTYMLFESEPHSLKRDNYISLEFSNGHEFYEEVKGTKYITPTFCYIECKDHYIYLEQDEGKIYVLVNDMDDRTKYKLIFNTIHCKGVSILTSIKDQF